MVAILLLLFHETFLGLDTQQIGTWLIWLAAVLTLWSMAYYLRQAVPEVIRHGR